jgi:hypothetical protein
MINSISEEACGVTHEPGNIAARIDHGIPRAALEGVAPPIPIAAQLLEVRIEIGVTLTAIEEGDLLAERDRRLNYVTA